MKVYDAQGRLIKVICNKCGKELTVQQGMLIEGMLEVKQNFGYFSHKDGETHAFDLCEACYDALADSFEIPVLVKEEFSWQVNQ